MALADGGNSLTMWIHLNTIPQVLRSFGPYLVVRGQNDQWLNRPVVETFMAESSRLG